MHTQKQDYHGQESVEIINPDFQRVQIQEILHKGCKISSFGTFVETEGIENVTKEKDTTKTTRQIYFKNQI